jgi:hypothetical protein
MNKDHLPKTVKEVAHRLKAHKNKCVEILKNDKIRAYICAIQNYSLNESAERIANAIFDVILEDWPNRFRDEGKLHGLETELSHVQILLAPYNLREILFVEENGQREIDDRIRTRSEFKKQLLAELQK